MVIYIIVDSISRVYLATGTETDGSHYSTERHIPEHFNTLFSGTEQLFNISLHVNSSCLGLWSDIYSY